MNQWVIYDAYVSYEFMKEMQEEKEKSRSKKEETNLVSAIFCGSHILLICTFQSSYVFKPTFNFLSDYRNCNKKTKNLQSTHIVQF